MKLHYNYEIFQNLNFIRIGFLLNIECNLVLWFFRFCWLEKNHHLGSNLNINHTCAQKTQHFSTIITNAFENSKFKKYIKYIFFLRLSLYVLPELMFGMSYISRNPRLTRSVEHKRTFSEIMVLVTEFTTLKFDSPTEFNEMSHFEIVFTIF